MTEQVGRLRRALTAFKHPRTPGRIMTLIKDHGVDALDAISDQLPSSERERLEEEVASLRNRQIDVVFFGDPTYPAQLASAPGAPPVLFFRGDPSLMSEAGVSMCGSRNVSDLGLQSAHACGREAASQGLIVMSGYARGVDMTTHIAALEMSGKTVIVLAEGINHFKIKKDLPRELVTADTVCAISQFPPSQPWTAGGAMTRNAVIVGLGLALVVVEAGDKGGTLAAGQHALKAGRPVLVLDFGSATPAGNKLLLDQGGTPVGNRDELAVALKRLLAESSKPVEDAPSTPEQLSLN